MSSGFLTSSGDREKLPRCATSMPMEKTKWRRKHHEQKKAAPPKSGEEGKALPPKKSREGKQLHKKRGGEGSTTQEWRPPLDFTLYPFASRVFSFCPLSPSPSLPPFHLPFTPLKHPFYPFPSSFYPSFKPSFLLLAYLFTSILTSFLTVFFTFFTFLFFCPPPFDPPFWTPLGPLQKTHLKNSLSTLLLTSSLSPLLLRPLNPQSPPLALPHTTTTRVNQVLRLLSV